MELADRNSPYSVASNLCHILIFDLSYKIQAWHQWSDTFEWAGHLSQFLAVFCQLLLTSSITDIKISSGIKNSVPCICKRKTFMLRHTVWSVCCVDTIGWNDYIFINLWNATKQPRVWMFKILVFFSPASSFVTQIKLEKLVGTMESHATWACCFILANFFSFLVFLL